MTQSALLAVLLFITLVGSAVAQESCELEEVKIGFQGKTCAYQNYAITLNGTVASGIGTQCVSFELFPNFTNKAWASLKVGETYQVTAGSALCITNINFDVPPGYVLYIDGVETNTIYKTNGGLIYSGDGTWDLVVRKKCACGTDGAAEAAPEVGSVIWQVGMGKLKDGRSAERISIREKVLSAAIYTPAALIYSLPAQTSDVEVLRNNGTLRQVKAPQTFADVVVINGSEYEIRYYTPTDVGPKVNGLYTFTGQAYVTWKISNPDPTNTTRLQISKVENGLTIDKSEYTWDPAIDLWSLSTGWSPSTATYSRIESKSISYPTGTSRTENFVVKESNGQVVSKRTKTYFTFPWGEELVQEVIDPDAAALTTTYTYYELASEVHRYRKVKSIQYPDGSWEKYDYDTYWNISTVIRPWKDLSFESATAENSHLTTYGYTNSDNGVYGISVFPRILFDVEEKINGVTVRKTRYNRSIAGVDPDMISVAEASYASSDNGQPVNLITQTVTTSYRFSAPEFLANRIASVVYPDGRKDSYSYEKGTYIADPNPALSQFTLDPNGLAERQTLVHGTAASPDGIAFKTTKEISVHDQYGNRVLEETYVYNGTGYERIAWSVMDYDGRGHVVMSRNHKGEMTTAVWTGEQKTSEIDTNGVETAFEYDSLNRIKKQTKKGIAAGGGFPAQADIVTSFVYDAEGRQKSETIGEGAGSLTSSRAYDRAGRIARETDQAGLSTTYSFTNGGRTQTITRPGGATEISDKYVDGQPKSVTGSAVVARYFDYGVNANGTQYTHEFTGPAGLSSPRWAKTTTDWIGRTVIVEKPSFTGVNTVQTSIYNTLGQLQKQTTTANTTKLIADKLYEYDELGQQTRSGSDIDGSGTLTLLSTDRLTETDTTYEKVSTDWFRVTSTRNYLTDNNDTPVIQTQRERLNNFTLNGTVQTVSEVTVTDVGGNNTQITTTTDRAAKKQTTTTDTLDSNINAVSISVNGLLLSSSPTTPQTATTYTYDSFGRPIAVTDPKTGTTSRTYSSTTGQLASTTEGAGTTNYEYYDAKHVNAVRLKSQTNAASKKIYFNYNSRGELIQTWGNATYPMEYIYDAYGQRIELHTFRAGQNWAASVWPASTTGTTDVTKWIYQESTGLLTQKQDATLKGATYTYDELGRQKTRIWARGITCTYGYDANTGELRTVTYSDSTPGVTFTYDRGGRQTNVTDAAGSHTRTFNVAGELQTEQVAGGILDGVGITVGYDGFLRRNSLQSSQGPNTLSSQSYGYDSASRLETITSGSQTATYAYYSNSGLLNTTTFAGSTSITRSYDGFGRLQNITTTPATDAPQSYTYTYNDLNQRTRVTREDSSYWSYVYNDRGELESGKKYWSDNSIIWGAQTEYTFDNVGNRNNAKNGGNQLGYFRQSNYTSNPLNQYSQRTVPFAIDVTGIANSLASVSVNNQTTVRKGDYFYKELVIDNTTASAYPQINVVGARNNFGAGGEDAVTAKGGRVFVPASIETFTYDDDGNLTSDGRWNYSWDAENRLVSMDANIGVPVEAKRRLEFVYDAGPRRVQKKAYVWNVSTSSYELQSTRKFVYDGWDLVVELDQNNSPVKTYAWTGYGLGIGRLLLVKEGAEVFQVENDGVGNVAVLINAVNGAYAASYEYDGFGQPLKVSGDKAASNSFRFSTKYTDPESGFVYYGFRFYDPVIGRFISRDVNEEEGGINLTAFVGNDAINHHDPFGLKRVRITATAFIPWEWVKIPEKTATMIGAGVPLVGPITGPGLSAAIDFFVHGDGRGPGEKPGGSYRLTAQAEVELMENIAKWPVVGRRPWTDNGLSFSEFRSFTGRVLHRPAGKGEVTSPDKAFQFERKGPCQVVVHIKMSGNVPAKVAIFPFNIDYEYVIGLTQTDNERIQASIGGYHDGFPGHELFLEADGKVGFKYSYVPSWFAKEPFGLTTAHPTQAQADGAIDALQGLKHKQGWFKPLERF